MTSETKQVGKQMESSAYGMHKWQLDAWEKQKHLPYLHFEVYRGPCAHGEPYDLYDGYVLPKDEQSSNYAHGWMMGRQSKE